ncbi:hypothetical protein A3C57_00845 [Candidatus Nomurabacteria bacterium RIFCSPHIGHO2_02_FULL_33_12]|uniref:Transcriptional repressor PaaX-like central Cas2-like domain-containing protein n=1 Tax=Candidatus Nomurabacteria bacterium RIFCSPLOWO2_01_FULL_33_17 TaxID=1801764 RepID=A0A1F6WR16_9BACT|nr:MAG: hypothetical protein A3C57_00845 [Candidatus Nomurabacteria bacterium RIFCSPHIGHO2_02_FULL_33_12]OGI84185.1 MAG: hypothetical protein A2903_01470 [Candidatus Nomurabacteria bacterium RIFCSPLOWO2_01_FULL_33_17]
MNSRWEDEASFIDLIISHLFSCKSKNIQRSILYASVQKRRSLNNKSFNSNLHRLQNKGLIKLDNKNILINKEYLGLHTKFKNIEAKPTGESKILVLFDIPEKKRKIRDWIRLQLKLWDFKMIQQSVWMGNGPLPKEFGDHLNLLGVKNCVKVFKISKTNLK